MKALHPQADLAILGDRNLELGPFSSDHGPEDAGSWTHWRMRLVAWYCRPLLHKAPSANTLSSEVLAEFDTILQTLETNPPRGIVIRCDSL